MTLPVPWLTRLSTIGATANEVGAISASYYSATTIVQAALDALIAPISNIELLAMLNTWRTSGGPFQDGYPGGGLPFGTGVALLTGDPADDALAIGAGTGRTITSGTTLVSIGTASPYIPNPGEMINVDTTSGGITMALPTAPLNGTLAGVRMTVGGIDPDTSNPSVVTMQTGGEDTFADGSTTFSVIYPGQMMEWVYDVVDGIWNVSSSFMPLETGLDLRFPSIDSPVVTGTLTADALAIAAIPGLTIPETSRGTLLTIGAPPFNGTTLYEVWKDWNRNEYMWTGAGWNGPGVTSPPTVNTDPVTIFAGTTATVTGEVTANALLSDYEFQLGTDGVTFATHVPSSPATAGSGTSPVQYSANFTGLTPGTTYFVQLVASNSAGTTDGTTTGNIVSFQTTPTNQAPTVVDTGPSGLSQTGVTLNGTVNPNGAATDFAYHVGTVSGTYTQTYGSGSNSGSSPVTVAPTITGLTPGTKYFYSLQADSTNGTTAQAIEGSFTTTATPAVPTITTGPVSAIGDSSALVEQEINPHGFPTTSVLHYGLTSAYGLTASPTSPSGAITGTTPQAVDTQLTGLTPGKLYHFAYVSTNSQGAPVQGPDQTFTTKGAPTAPANAGGSALPAITTLTTFTVGATLTCSQGTWTGTTPITYAYQWQRDGTNIAGQNGQTYVTQGADAPHNVGCVVTATNSVNGVPASATAVAITSGGGGAPTPVGPPVVT